jgi:hypothetical protein
MKKGFAISILCLVFLLGISVGVVGASGVNEEITAMINREVRIKLNGKDFVPINTDGSPMYPISYKGSNYLPVRALANALSIAVDYDPTDKIIYLGEKDRVPLEGKDFMKNYTCQLSVEPNQLLVNGKQYQWGIVYTGTEGYYEYSGFIYPNGKYQKFGGVACMQDMDDSTEEVIIKIRENDYQGKVLKEITVKKGESIPFEIDIPQVKTLYFQNLVSDRVPKSTNPDIMMIAEPYFK